MLCSVTREQSHATRIMQRKITDTMFSSAINTSEYEGARRYFDLNYREIATNFNIID